MDDIIDIIKRHVLNDQEIPGTGQFPLNSETLKRLMGREGRSMMIQAILPTMKRKLYEKWKAYYTFFPNELNSDALKEVKKVIKDYVRNTVTESWNDVNARPSAAAIPDDEYDHRFPLTTPLRSATGTLTSQRKRRHSRKRIKRNTSKKGSMRKNKRRILSGR